MTTYTAVLHFDATGWWFVEAPELPGCHTQGRTIDQARDRIREAIALWLDAPEDNLAFTTTSTTARPGKAGSLLHFS